MLHTNLSNVCVCVFVWLVFLCIIFRVDLLDFFVLLFGSKMEMCVMWVCVFFVCFVYCRWFLLLLWWYSLYKHTSCLVKIV